MPKSIPNPDQSASKLTKREFAAIQIAVGITASETPAFALADDKVAKLAVARADALLKKLQEG